MKKFCLALVLVAVFGNETFSETVESACVPVNAYAFKLTRPDGKVDYFFRAHEDPDQLEGGGSWFGVVDGDTVTLMTQPGCARRDGLQFRKGHLVKILDNGRERLPVANAPLVTKDLSALWEIPFANQHSEKNLDIWRDSGRLRLWFVNPNTAGLFLLGLACLFFGLTNRRNRLMRWIGWSGTGLFVVAMALTSSRGAMLGLLTTGALLILPRIRFSVSNKALLILCLIMVALIGGLFMMPERFTTGFFTEYSETSRLPIWAEVPRMMCAAPWGWGLGESGLSYCGWFQAIERDHFVRTLMSTHLTWMVEFGFCFAFVYLAVWFFLIIQSYRNYLKYRRCTSFVVFCSFFVAAMFNTVGNDPWVWIAPGLALVSFVATRSRPTLRVVVVAFCLAAVTVAGIALAGMSSPRMITASRGCVSIGQGMPKTVVADDRIALQGGLWSATGKELREYYTAYPKAAPLMLVGDLKKVPESLDCLVLVGRMCSAFIAEQSRYLPQLGEDCSIVMISPDVKPSEIPQSLVSRGLRVYQGEFAARLCDSTPDFVSIVAGAELYLPDWIDIVLTTAQTRKNK